MIKISPASKQDLADVIELFWQIDGHYFGARAPTRKAMSAHARKKLFPARHGIQIAIAREGSQPLGIATFAILFPAPGMSGQLFMKDLFTVKEARGKGVGKAIMRFLANYALKTGCSRFDWTAETDNATAIKFYDRLGIPRVKEKVYYRLDKNKLRAFARTDAHPSDSTGRASRGLQPT